MLHLHFGAGRLGLGLVAPFLQSAQTELVLLNRSAPRPCENAAPTLSSYRRNRLLSTPKSKRYLLQTPGGSLGIPAEIQYDRFATYDVDTASRVVKEIVAASSRARSGVIVTASLLQAANYHGVIHALNRLSAMKRAGAAIGPLFFVACENSFGATDVFNHPSYRKQVLERTRSDVTLVKVLVDRLCVRLEEANTDAGPLVCARAEMYGSLKLGLNDDTEALRSLCAGSKVEFSPFVDVERQIKIWLLNGSHWLLALAALESRWGHPQINLNQYLTASEENKAFARQIMSEMKEGVETILRTEPQYAEFNRSVDVRDYLDGAASSIMQRFVETDDPLSRILARFKAPTPEAFSGIDAFSGHFADRVGKPMRAYEHKRGVAPPAASHSVHSMLKLVASGDFIGGRAY